MFFVLVFPLLVMYFSLLRCVFQLPSQLPVRQPSEGALENERDVLACATRRSTRISHAIQVRVTAIDSSRGLCTEQVAADTVSCHGFAFKWKYDVPIDSKVVLELDDQGQNGRPVFARGVVKWHRGPVTSGQDDLFYTAVQLEKPDNIWKVASPPADWLPYCQPKYFIPAQTGDARVASRYVS
jgi:hypothetical protein